MYLYNSVKRSVFSCHGKTLNLNPELKAQKTLDHAQPKSIARGSFWGCSASGLGSTTCAFPIRYLRSRYFYYSSPAKKVPTASTSLYSRDFLQPESTIHIQSVSQSINRYIYIYM